MERGANLRRLDPCLCGALAAARPVEAAGLVGSEALGIGRLGAEAVPELVGQPEPTLARLLEDALVVGAVVIDEVWFRQGRERWP